MIVIFSQIKSLLNCVSAQVRLAKTQLTASKESLMLQHQQTN